MEQIDILAALPRRIQSDPHKPHPALLSLLQHIHTYPITTKSDVAREHADMIANLSSRGLITTEVVPHSSVYGRLWKISFNGLFYLTSNAYLIHASEIADFLDEPQGRYPEQASEAP